MFKGLIHNPAQLTLWVDLILFELNSICLDDVGTSQYFILHRNPVQSNMSLLLTGNGFIAG